MGSHPVNLAVRFLLEISALIFVGIWAWKIGEGLMSFIAGLGMPITLAVIWGIFAVPNDPSRSGKAPIVTPGAIRLAIELSIFSFSTWTLYDLEWTKICAFFGLVVVLHYAISYDRIKWLMTRKK